MTIGGRGCFTFWSFYSDCLKISLEEIKPAVCLWILPAVRRGWGLAGSPFAMRPYKSYGEITLETRGRYYYFREKCFRSLSYYPQEMNLVPRVIIFFSPFLPPSFPPSIYFLFLLKVSIRYQDRYAKNFHRRLLYICFLWNLTYSPGPF